MSDDVKNDERPLWMMRPRLELVPVSTRTGPPSVESFPPLGVPEAPEQSAPVKAPRKVRQLVLWRAGWAVALLGCIPFMLTGCHGAEQGSEQGANSRSVFGADRVVGDGEGNTRSVVDGTSPSDGLTEVDPPSDDPEPEGSTEHLRGDDPPEGGCGDGGCPQMNHTNVVVILFDDLGIGDLGAYGGTKIRTPQIDKMAAEGMRFNNFYVAPWCGPTRSSLLEGRRLGYTHVRDTAKHGLPDNLPLMPESFKSAGYHTGMFGKWGLADVVGGYHIGSGFSILAGAPENAGFDEFVGFLTHRDAHVHYLDNPANPADDSPENPYYDDIRRQLFKIQGGVTVPHVISPDRYVQDEFAAAAVDFIHDHAADPFFLYVPFSVPHVELIAPEDEILQYYRDQDWPEEAYNPPTSGPGSGKKRPQPETFATYAAMVERGDRDVGRILQALHENGIADNTLVVLASDNGPLLGNYRTGAHVDFFDSAAGRRGYKFDIWEGGVAAPLIAWWPNTIPASTTSDVQVGVWDIFPTVAEATGAPVPAAVNGKSFLPVLTQGSTEPVHDTVQLEGWTGVEWTGTAQV
ncbi:MAG: sulfatase-like hydrolase/transferase, partial [Myxococcota bacterium]|nr:sulfatase-like hydrolase/transferase [Myxococcota bacterium]